MNIKENIVTPKVKWILVIVGIILIIGAISYFGKSSVLGHYQKFIDNAIAEKTKDIIAVYNTQKDALQKQITSKQAEINNKDILLKEKEKRIKDAENRVSVLQAANAILIQKLNAILLPVTPEETQKRLKELGYETCR